MEEFDDEFEREEGRALTTPEPEELDAEEEDETEEQPEQGFVEIPDAEYHKLSLSEQRRYRSQLEEFKKQLKRENARQRKKLQRQREKQTGVKAETANKLHALWRKNREDVQRPEHAEEFAELKERLAEFSVVHRQTSAAIKRMLEDVHPEALPEAGRFPEIIGQNLLDLVKRYGIGTVLPTECIPIFIDAKFHAHRAAALQKMNDDPEMHYEMRFGLEITRVSEYDFYNYFSVFFDWYLTHRPDSSMDYEWVDVQNLARDFVIPEKFLHESPGSGIRYIWCRLDNFRSGINPKLQSHGQGMTSTSEILENDQRVLKTLRDLGY